MTNEEFEQLASDFYKETGMLPPGKDDRLGDYSREERSEKWSEWLKERNK